ncbi:MAG TPA: hypothetical protein VEG34_12600, partial [Thermoanaerobaculia bacterium]|nr:hypothetical protein [Thermoanaerobaculia bacterium]
MSAEPLSTAERWRRHQRDLEAYRRRHLWRRSHARFRRDLSILPHLFLLPGQATMSPLLRPPEEVLQALRGRAVWTLDTAARLVLGWGFLAAPDLQAYLATGDLQEIDDLGLVGPPQTAGIGVDPVFQRPAMLLSHQPALSHQDVPSVELPSGDLVVSWDHLTR